MPRGPALRVVLADREPPLRRRCWPGGGLRKALHRPLGHTACGSGRIGLTADASVTAGKVAGSTARAVVVVGRWPKRAGSAMVRSCSRMAPNTAKNATPHERTCGCYQAHGCLQILGLSAPETPHKAS